MHIGNEIRKVLKDREMTVVELASRLSCTRVNVYKIFEKHSIDTELLLRISIALEYDFFSLYNTEVETKKR